jgi:predicted RNase H-like HicB family nuclease
MNKEISYYLSLPYKTILEFEHEDKSWVAYCPELGRGTCYAIGESKSEALELLEETKKTIFEYAIEEGKKIPEPVSDDDELPSGNFILRLPRTTHKKLKAEAENEGVSLNQYVLSVLSEHLGWQNAKSKFTKTSDSEDKGTVTATWKGYSHNDNLVSFIKEPKGSKSKPSAKKS